MFIGNIPAIFIKLFFFFNIPLERFIHYFQMCFTSPLFCNDRIQLFFNSLQDCDLRFLELEISI